jgi:hypothetical protein
MDKKSSAEDTVVSVSLTVIFIFTLTLLYMMVSILPKYLERYVALAIELPGVTRAFIQTVMLLRSLPLMLPTVVTGFLVGVVLINIMRNKRTVAKIYMGISIFLIFSALLLCFVLHLPFIR